jgi:hypothetical protein
VRSLIQSPYVGADYDAAIVEGKWFRTGDSQSRSARWAMSEANAVGYVQNNYWYISDRLKEMVSGHVYRLQAHLCPYRSSTKVRLSQGMERANTANQAFKFTYAEDFIALRD